MENNQIVADNGKVFVRMHDNFVMSNEIILGYDYSTGVKRLDKAEYYREELETDLYGEENELEDE